MDEACRESSAHAFLSVRDLNIGELILLFDYREAVRFARSFEKVGAAVLTHYERVEIEAVLLYFELRGLRMRGVVGRLETD